MKIQVAFTGTWLTDPTDPTTSVRLGKVERDEASTVPGEVRQLAARRMVIRKPGRDAQVPLTATMVTAEQVAQLEEWQGRVLLLRDGTGWRRWGTYFDLSVSTLTTADQAQQWFQVSFTWRDTDYDESV